MYVFVLDAPPDFGVALPLLRGREALKVIVGRGIYLRGVLVRRASAAAAGSILVFDDDGVSTGKSAWVVLSEHRSGRARARAIF